MISGNRLKTDPPAVIRLCRILLVSLVGVSVLFFILDSRGTLRVDTSLSDMTPAGGKEESLQPVLSALTDFAESSVVLLLESSNEQNLQEASDLVARRLKTEPTLAKFIDREALSVAMLGFLDQYRYQLLSDDHQAQLINGDDDLLLEDALSELYSPGDVVRPLSFEKDPLNLFGSWFESLSLNVGDQVKETPKDSPYFQRVLNIRLMGHYNRANEQDRLVTLFHDLELELGELFPTVTVLRHGVLFFASESAIAAKNDINRISIGSIVGLMIILILVFRSLWPLVVPVLSIVLGVVTAFAVVHTVFGAVHVFTVVFGASLIGIVIDYSIHYFYHVHLSRKKSDSTLSEEGYIDHRLIRALVLSLLTSVVGFAALMASSVPSLQKISVFSIVGLVTAWLTVMAFGPCLAGSSVKVKDKLVDPIARLLSYIALRVVVAPGRTGWMLFILACIAVIVVFLRGQDDPRRFIDMPKDLLEESQLLNAKVSTVESGRFVLVEKKSEQAVFDTMKQLGAMVGEKNPLISFVDWVPSPAIRQQNYRLQGEVYASGGIAGQLIETIASGADQSEELEQLALIQRASYETAARLDLPVVEMFEELGGAVAPLIFQDQGKYLGIALMARGGDVELLRTASETIEGAQFIDTISHTSDELRKHRQASLVSLLLSYLVIGALLLRIYGGRSALAMLAVPASASLVTLALFGLTGQGLTLFHTMALFMILGLGMDYVIFLKEMTTDSRATQQAIVLSGMTTLISFGLLAISSIPVASGFGLTVLLGNFLNLMLALGLYRLNWYSPARLSAIGK